MAGETKVCDYTFNFLQQLGRGGFGTVYKGWDKDQNTVAIKQISKNDRRKASAEAIRFHLLKENISNEHIVKVYHVKTWMDSMWIMMEYCDLGDLNRFFEKYYPKLDMMKRAQIMKQIAKGIAFLHCNDIVHRDIKPPNILLKTNNGHAVVKLGDFGLSKFLDPNDETSSMSSDVGTLRFKAPEFWDKKPGNKVRYHRNVDVYAAGLTFIAMLQARPKCNLVPKAQDSLLSFETKMPIGLAAFTRYLNRKSQIQVAVVDINQDTLLLKELKLVIQAMTWYSPEARISAAELETKLEVAIEHGGRTTAHLSHLTIGEVFFPSKICYINSKLIVTSHSFSKLMHDMMRVYHQETGDMLLELPRCHASSCVVALEVQGKEHILEGCSTCHMIRGYDLQEGTGTHRVLLKGIRPSHINKWTDRDAIVVFEEELQFINLLRYSADQFHIVGRKFPVRLHGIAEICYSRCSPFVMFLHDNKKTVSAIAPGTSQIAWQHTKPGCFINDIATLPDGQVCIVVNYTKLCVLDPRNGTILHTLPGSEHLKLGVVYSVATCYTNNNQQKLAIQHGKPEDTQISCYKVKSTLPPRAKPTKPSSFDFEYHINVEDLVCEETNSEAKY